jgi:hypothetical protein
MLPIGWVGEEYRHHFSTAVQVVKSLEQGYKSHSVGHSHFCSHQEQSQYVTGLLAHTGDHGVNDCRAIALVRLGNHAPGRDDVLRCLGQGCGICRKEGAWVCDLTTEQGLLLCFR